MLPVLLTTSSPAGLCSRGRTARPFWPRSIRSGAAQRYRETYFASSNPWWLAPARIGGGGLRTSRAARVPRQAVSAWPIQTVLASAAAIIHSG
jgi:hypothetical protein